VARDGKQPGAERTFARVITVQSLQGALEDRRGQIVGRVSVRTAQAEVTKNGRIPALKLLAQVVLLVVCW
jgi:hypothetical protein